VTSHFHSEYVNSVTSGEVSSQIFYNPQKRTRYKTVDPVFREYNKTLTGENGTVIDNFTMAKEELVPGSDTVPAGLEIAARSMNVLGLVVFSIVFGIVLGRVGERGLPVKAFFESLNEIIMEMVSLVMW